MSKNHDASIKNLEVQIGFTGDTVDNPKNDSCKAIEKGFEVITKKGENEIVEEDLIEKEEVRIEKKESNNLGDQEEKGVTIEQLKDKISPWRRTKKKILNDLNPELSYYIKPPYPIIKKKPVHENEAGLFAKFKEMLITLQALLNDIKHKSVKEDVNMTEKDETEVSPTLALKLKDLGKFNTACTNGGVKILHALCDLGSSINVIPLNKVKEFNLEETISSNMTLTLDDLFVTHPLGILQDVLVHVDGLVFPVNFVVIDKSRDSRGPVILGRSFLKTEKALIYVETDELSLKFNKEKVIFNVYEWAPHVVDLETCYRFEEKGNKVEKGESERELTGVRESSVTVYPEDEIICPKAPVNASAIRRLEQLEDNQAGNDKGFYQPQVQQQPEKMQSQQASKF
ncbi:uncharacterized protein LOC127098101 [Lathyrus oleraceus]|uniref:uncharacterized protein LOC127098101 n=1 Tax=Pisum sativum TaxID=3888 RepID=UPI0021D1FFF2|nr:uncharacterized protein LOC127098101 [Pisum sativum]